MGASVMDKAPEMVELMSVYSEHRVRLESPEEIIDARNGKYRVPGTGKEIKFHNNKAKVPADWIPYLESHPDRLIQRGLVNRTEEFTRLPEVSGGVRVSTGAQAAGVGRINQAPREGWDTATTRTIQEWIASGQVGDLEHAEVYEKAHQRRKMVVRALVDAQLEGPAPDPDDDEPIAAEVVSAPIPEGQGGL